MVGVTSSIQALSSSHRMLWSGLGVPKCSFPKSIPTLNQYFSSQTEHNRAIPCFSFLSCWMPCHNFFDAFPNVSHTQLFASLTGKTPALLPLLSKPTKPGKYPSSVWQAPSPLVFTSVPVIMTGTGGSITRVFEPFALYSVFGVRCFVYWCLF